MEDNLYEAQTEYKECFYFSFNTMQELAAQSKLSVISN